jgi:hypothetical protein
LDVAAYLYPWDVLGDPGAAEWVAGLGLDHAVLAAGYHATRALTPRHPEHRVVTAPHSAAYYPTWDAAWRGSQLRPPAATWLPGPDPFGAVVDALAAAGVPVHAWLVLSHVDLTAGADTANCVVNAYGDRYPWALCPARDAVLRYAVTYAAEVAARPGIAGIELEACGWYGFDHGSAHDKTAGLALAQARQYLLSLCFCGACRTGYRRAGIHPDELAARVRDALDPAFQGLPEPDRSEQDAIEAQLGPDLAAAVAGVRGAVADGLRAQVVAAVRDAAPGRTVALHATPRPHRATAFAGVDVRVAGAAVDRLVVNCWHGTDPVAETRVAAGAQPVSVVASLLAVAGLGGHPADLPAQVATARAAGADGVRLYHAGLAGAADLAAIASMREAT